MTDVTTVIDSGNVLVDALVWGSRWGDGVGQQVITVGYSTDGGTFTPTNVELAAINATLALYERYINVDFQLDRKSVV